MSPVCFNILRVMADLQGLFIGSFLRKFDTDDALLIEVFNESERIIDELGNLRTPLHDSFLAGLSEDGNGNILFIKADSSGEEYTIMLQVSTSTNQTNRNKIERIIDESKDIEITVFKSQKVLVYTSSLFNKRVKQYLS